MKKFLKRFFSRDEVPPASSNEIFIWPDGARGPEGKSVKEKIRIINGEQVISNVHHPSVTPYLPPPENATGVAVIIAPGGGHKELWADHEGHNPARFLCEHGIAAFVLKYRLARGFNSKYTIDDHALADMQQAIRFVRSHAADWKINNSRIGVMGFSAGGEIAALAAMHFDDGNKNADDMISQQSSYPNFQALIYPAGTRRFSVLKNSPPLFLLCGKNDKEICKAVSKIHLMYKEAGISSELHVYPDEGHGFGVRKNNNSIIAKWPERFLDWLAESGFL